MNVRKVAALLLAVIMVTAALTGCAGSQNADTQNKEEVSKDDSNSNDTPSDGIVTLKWLTVGNGMPDNYEAWQKNINDYLGEKIGVNIDMEVVSWGDWDNRKNVVVSSGEYFDIIFTDLNKYNSEAELGAFLDISDLVKTASPDLYSYIPEQYWDATKINEKIYSVPTYKDSSATQYFVYDKAIVDKYQIDYQNVKSLADLTDKLEEVKNGEGSTPFMLDHYGLGQVFSMNYDLMGAGLPAMGVRIDDENRKVVSVLEQEDVLANLEVLHDWYQKGIINADAPSNSDMPTYRMVFVGQGWASAAQTTWGPNMGCEAVAGQLGDSIVSNDTVRGSLNAIYSGTKYPEKCLELLQIVNLDSYVRDAFYYGLEGENFNYTDDNKIEKLNNDWTMAGYTQGTFFTVSQLTTDTVNQWEEVKQLNENAKPSVLLGFNFDTSNVKTELANCSAVYEKYRSELLTGAKEPREYVKQLKEELDSAGFQKVIEEAQKQIDAAFNK
jgi:putative aldouronate transport system substrate-binding protein